MFKYSKTRMLYYNNKPSKLKLDTLTDFKYTKPFKQKPTSTVTIAIPNTEANGHNWQTIPYNQLGLYLTEGEMQCLVENCSEITFKSAEITVSNIIPLAKIPASQNSTSLSFNNTIYSMIVIEDTNYVGVANQIGLSDIPHVFFRTFDGVSAADAVTRTSLSVHELLFKIPYCYPNENGDYTDNDVGKITVPVNINGIVPGKTTVNNLNISSADKNTFLCDYKTLIDCYIPEFLQNNDKVYILYPGENQFVHKYTPTNNKYNTIDLNGPHFDELINNLDLRFATLQNNNMSNPNVNFGLIHPFPQCKGFPLDTADMYTTTEITEAANGATLNQAQVNAQIFNKFMLLEELLFKRDYDDAFTDICPKYFIKGCPIVDSDNSLVNHEFHGLFTWTMEIETKPRLMANTNRLQWAMTYQMLEKYIDKPDLSFTGTNYNAFKHRVKYTRNFAKKPMLTRPSTSAALKLRQTSDNTTLNDVEKDVLINTRTGNKLTLNPTQFKDIINASTSAHDDETDPSFYTRRLPHVGMNTGFSLEAGLGPQAPI